MTKNATGCRIYVACLASYNAGHLHGEWIDADQDADDIREEITAMLRNSPHPNTVTECPRCAAVQDHAEPDCELCQGSGEVPTAEEWAIHDHEGFGGIKLGEHEDIDTVADLAAALGEHGEPFAVWYANESRDGVDVDAFEEQYRGTYRTLGDYAEQLADDIGMFDHCNETVKAYFDFERWASDMELGGDIWTHEGGDGVYVFDSR